MKSIKQINIKLKTVLVRVDYNVPLDDKLNIVDDNRILATCDLINYLLDEDSKVILISHMGRPKGIKDSSLSLVHVAKRLSELLNKEVLFVNDCVGSKVNMKIKELRSGQILLLENLRFHIEEQNNDDNFARQLASYCDVFVNEAFSVSHRYQASITGVPKFVLESASGFLLEKELLAFNNAFKSSVRPLVAVIGGAKVSSKLGVLENMLRLVDKLIIGGAMANTFLKSQGIDTKDSMIEKDLVNKAAQIIKKAEKNNTKLLLPSDLVCAKELSSNVETKNVSITQIPEKYMAFDIGMKTALRYADAIKDAKTIVWNGTMGVFEIKEFMAGTQKIAQAIAESKAYSIVGGGDTGLAVKNCGIIDKVGYISTGGGAFLHLMGGNDLPGVLALQKPDAIS